MKKVIWGIIVLLNISLWSVESIYEDSYIDKMKGLKNIVDTGILNGVNASNIREGKFRGVVRFKPIFFEGRDIKVSSTEVIDDIMKMVKSTEGNGYYITLLGHTSSHNIKMHNIDRGAWSEFWHNLAGGELKEEDSISLGNSFIKSVYDILLENNIDKSTIYTENRLGYDKLYTEATTKGSSLNNRVDVSLYLINNINLHINFKLDSSIIISSYNEIVINFAKFLKNNPDASALIIGHTDKQGSYDYNMALSNRRAEATKRMLVGMGVNSEQLKTIGKAYSEPLDNQSNKEAYRKNRRIEAQLTYNAR